LRFSLSDKVFGQSDSVFVIAEISANHAQCFDKAVELVKAAKKCGADAVKFQAYTPETMTIDCKSKYFQLNHPKWGGQTLYDLYKTAYTPWEWFGELKKLADELGIMFLSTAFDKTSVDMLEELGVCAHKIASFELVDLSLIAYAAKTAKPLVISTGMGTIDEIDEAVQTARASGAGEVILLKCVSSYPAKAREMNLRTIGHMRDHFNCPIGFSDHSLSAASSICAVSLGACVVEKHFTLSRQDDTPDSFFSIEPAELEKLIEDIRTCAQALGTVQYGSTKDEQKNTIFRRSLFVIKDVKAGDKVTADNVRCIRPGNGLAGKYMTEITGTKFSRDTQRGTPLSFDLITPRGGVK